MCGTGGSGQGSAGNIRRYTERLFVTDSFGIEPNNKNKITNNYLYYYLKSNLQTYIYSLRTGANQLHIYYKDIKNIKIHLPPINIQNQIVEQVNQKENLINLLKDNMNHAISQVNDIMSQLLTN